MIFAHLLLFPTILLLLPSPLYLLPKTAHTCQHLASMSELNQEIMKQLLADQARSLLSELKDLVNIEVAKQMENHVNQLAQLHDEQILLRKQINDLTTQLSAHHQPACPAWPSSTPPLPTATVPSASPTHTHVTPPSPTPALSHLDIIDTAKHTLVFQPVSHDALSRMKTVSGNAPNQVLLTMALHEFLKTEMGMPLPIIHQIGPCKILYQPEINPGQVTVEFSTLKHVKTIFKFVKNLSPGKKVSPLIPPVLSAKYDDLQSQAYHVRNGKIRHKTVIKYHGNTLVLYAKPTNSGSWQLVPEKANLLPHHDMSTGKPDDPMKTTISDSKN